jgi:hypothetical protein
MEVGGGSAMRARGGGERREGREKWAAGGVGPEEVVVRRKRTGSSENELGRKEKRGWAGVGWERGELGRGLEKGKGREREFGEVFSFKLFLKSFCFNPFQTFQTLNSFQIIQNFSKTI